MHFDSVSSKVHQHKLNAINKRRSFVSVKLGSIRRYYKRTHTAINKTVKNLQITELNKIISNGLAQKSLPLTLLVWS